MSEYPSVKGIKSIIGQKKKKKLKTLYYCKNGHQWFDQPFTFYVLKLIHNGLQMIKDNVYQWIIL